MRVPRRERLAGEHGAATDSALRADRSPERVYGDGQLVKVSTCPLPGHRVTDPPDWSAESTEFAIHDFEHLRRLAARHAASIGVSAAALLEHHPWTDMGQVDALSGS